jgi:hypothetical protein
MRGRKIRTGWDRNDEVENTYRAWAECDDEITYVLIALPDDTDQWDFIKKAYLITEEEMADSKEYQELRESHIQQCDACQRWLKKEAKNARNN